MSSVCLKRIEINIMENYLCEICCLLFINFKVINWFINNNWDLSKNDKVIIV